jgi:hypothetical protein
MFRRARYQHGMLSRVKRSQGPDCWIFRWRETNSSGKRVRRNAILGTVERYPTEGSALKAAEALRITINEDQPRFPQQPVSVAALITHFKSMSSGPSVKTTKAGRIRHGSYMPMSFVYTSFLSGVMPGCVK